jgi:sulfatase maturation enzyme AslB (radical SAM superfamily)
MKNSYYKGYWMVTNRCNLRCSYCVLENAPHQLRAELSLEEKKELVSHLYHKLHFRRLTLSGGEVLIFGKHPPKEFLELLTHIKTFKSPDGRKNLEIELYTNGTYLTDAIADQMAGVVDRIAVTIDGTNNDFLSEIGRNHKNHTNYFDHIVAVVQRLSSRGIDVKLHSVVGQKNHLFLPEEVPLILDAIEKSGGSISAWKFFQYMSYDAPEKDTLHHIEKEAYEVFKEKVLEKIPGSFKGLHFKDNAEMNASLFNILSYGNAQYMRDGDSWTTSKRTRDLREYASMEDLFNQHDINQTRFRQFHEISR